jgi:hypothetical protein
MKPRVDCCLNNFIRTRLLGIRPTSVTCGTMVHALTSIADEPLSDELFTVVVVAHHPTTVGLAGWAPSFLLPTGRRRHG